MSIEKIRSFIKEKAEQFGAKTDNEFNKPYVERNNTGQEALKDNGAYFGFIHPEEEASETISRLFIDNIFRTTKIGLGWFVLESALVVLKMITNLRLILD
ncbi:MAG: hypothetical protein U5L09_02720 [Bacteroidales bacterium]|nr:hypothetical protein [Bacteroidales bacterium]